MTRSLRSAPLASLALFFGGVFVLLAQMQRAYLLAADSPIAASVVDLLGALIDGLIRDIAVAAGCLTIVALFAAVAVGAGRLAGAVRLIGSNVSFTTACWVGGWIVGALMFMTMIVDAVYVGYFGHHLDFVFMEYVEDLLASLGKPTVDSQSGQQMAAELNAGWKWQRPVMILLTFVPAGLWAWWRYFQGVLLPRLGSWPLSSPMFLYVAAAMLVGIGAAGLRSVSDAGKFDPGSPGDALYSLGQNPILYAWEPLSNVVFSRWIWTPAWPAKPIPIEEAIATTRRHIDPKSLFPDDDYPLVHLANTKSGLHLARRSNILLVFVEGLDRRYLGRTMLAPDGRTIEVTPFLNRSRHEAFYFENFFANGVQTSRGLFATLCSAFPRHGTAVIKTRFDADYLCLPELLRRAGYRTEMIAAQQEDINNLSTFTARNGIERFIDEHHVDGERQHLGIGLTDRALFEALAARVRHYQSTGERFLLLTLTVGTHHPFTVPHDDAEVVALSKVEDGYPGALRVADRELARFLSDLRRDNLLRDTVVVVLGDHGRHEPTGTTPWERQIGHFLAPLFIWMPDDDSAIPKPAVIKTVTSQVDVAPTLLALNGLLPRHNAFMGRDVSCLFVGGCAAENAAYLSSVYDDIVGVADQQGIAVVSLRTGAFASGDLALSQRPATDATPGSNARFREVLSLYLASNALIEAKRVWSWTKFQEDL